MRSNFHHLLKFPFLCLIGVMDLVSLDSETGHVLDHVKYVWSIMTT
jgi:hypothetical protein